MNVKCVCACVHVRVRACVGALVCACVRMCVINHLSVEVSEFVYLVCMFIGE